MTIGSTPVVRWGVALVLLTVVTRLPAVLHPRPINDEDFYSLVAFEMLDGGKPYADAVERKPPLLFWTYALVFRVVGKYNWFGLHVAAVLWTLLTMGGLFLLGRTLFDEKVGLVAALLYSVYQPFGVGSNLAFNGEMLMNLPIVAGMWLAVRPAGSRLRPDLVGAGALLCAAFLLKQPAAVAAIPVGGYLLLPGYRRARQVSRGVSVLHAGLLTAGWLGALGVVVAILKAQGIFDEALYWTITDHDLPHGPLDPFFWRRGLGQSLWFFLACGPLVIGAVPSIRESWSSRATGLWNSRRPELMCVIGLVVASAVGTAASGRFYAHYFIQIILPLSLLAAPVYARVWTHTVGRRRRWGFSRLTQVWIGITVVGFGVAHVATLRDERGDSEAGSYIRERSNANDRIFVWGVSSKIYLDARRRPASRYIATYPLTGHIFGSPQSWDPEVDTSYRIAPGAWEKLEEDFARHPPLYIVDTDAGRATPRYPMEDYPTLRRVLLDYEVEHRARGGVIYRRVGGGEVGRQAG